MNIALVVPNDTLYAPLYVKKIVSLLEGTGTHHDITICVWNPCAHKSFASLVAERFRLYGAVQFSIFCMLMVLTRIGGVVSTIIPVRRPCSLRALSRECHCEYEEVNSINEKGFIALMQEKSIEVLVSIAVNEKYKADILNAVPFALNVHSSLIPRYRGVMALFWAHFCEERTIGVTVHRMVETYDSGAILGQCEFALPSNATLHTLYLKSIDEGSRCIAEVINAISNKSVEERNPDCTVGSYYSFPSAAESREYRKRGKRFFAFQDLWRQTV